MIELAVALLGVSVFVLCCVNIQLDKRMNKAEDEMQELQAMLRAQNWGNAHSSFDDVKKAAEIMAEHEKKNPYRGKHYTKEPNDTQQGDNDV